MQSSSTECFTRIFERMAAGVAAAEAFRQEVGLPAAQAEALLAAVEGVFTFVRAAPATDGTVVDDEREGIKAAMRLASPMVEARIQKRLSLIDEQQVEAAKCRNCGEKAHSVGRIPRKYGSLAGRIQARRRVVSCEPCGLQFAPAEAKAGLSGGDFTPRMEEVCTLLATTVPHEMAVRLLEMTLGVQASEYGVQQMVERRGSETEQLLHEEAARQQPYEESGLPRELPPSTVPPPKNVAYLEMDGVIPITREQLPEEALTPEDKARMAKAEAEHARGGKGRRYKIVGKEVKNAILYEAEACAQESPGRGCLLKKHYVSYLGDWKVFATLVWAALLSHGFERARLLVVLSDGAEWIRSLVAWLPVQVFLILDLFHVLHRISEVATAVYGEGTADALAWANVQKQRIENGRAQEVIDALQFLQPASANAQKKVTELGGYLRNNLDRMDYPSYRARGLRVGSGAIESANFHVTGGRLILQGMRWSEAGARQMAALRADLFNGVWEDRTRQILANRAA